MNRIAWIRWMVFLCAVEAPITSVAQSLICGQNHADQITAAGQQDVLFFQASAGDTISLVLWQTGGSSFTAHADLYAPSSTSTPVHQDLNGENQLDLMESGTYILRVHASNFFHTGTYSLEINWLAPQPCNVTPIQCGQNVAGTVADRCEQHFYSFAAEAGDTISLVLWQIGGANFIAHGDLYGPSSGTTPLFVDLNGQTQIDLTQTGQYTLRVHASSFFYTGTYALEFNTLAPIARQCDVTPIVCGGNVSATITERAEQHFYSFAAQAGDTISLVLWQIGGANFIAHGDLYGPSSLPTALLVDLNGQTQIDLLESGQYTLRVHASSFFYTGTYALEFNTLAPIARQCDVTPIVCGGNVPATVTERAEQHFYSFAAQAGDTISLVLWQIGGANFIAHGDLYGPSSLPTALFVDLNGETQIDLLETGQYTLRVHASSFFYTGTYALEFNTLAPITRQCDVTPIACGGNVSAAITARAEQHFYSFAAQAGDTISLVLSQTGGSNFIAHAELYEPDSPAAYSADLNGVNPITLDQSGTYTLVVHASSHFYTGTYALGLTWTAPYSQQCYEFVRGDASLDQTTNLLDVILTLNYLFLNEPRPCLEALDSNDDAGINLVDPIYTLNYLFAGGAPSPPPFPMCGLDPSPLTSLGCSPAACP